MKTYTTLDAIVVIYTLSIVAGVVAGLMILEIPQQNLPVLASIAAGALGIPVAYGAFRWGNSVATKAAQDTAVAAITAGQNTQRVEVTNTQDNPVPTTEGTADA